MTTVINSLRPTLAQTVCNFGWYYGSIGSPQRLAEYTYTEGSTTYPPGFTKTAGGSVTLPTGSNVQVVSTTSFEPAGPIALYAGPSSHTTGTYTVVDSTHLAISGGVGTFAAGTTIYDPRMYIDPLPLNAAAIFDATDSNNLGLNKTIAPAGVSVVDYIWDLGNGDIGYGPVVTTAYNYNIPPPIQVKLTILDSLGRQYSAAHRITLQSLTFVYGTSLIERQGSART